MDTLINILNKTTTFLKNKGVPEPLLEAQLLLAHVLKCSRLELYLDATKPIQSTLLDTLRPLMIRRGKREPLQYILEAAPFTDFKLYVNRNVLIPRPETEELTEYVKQTLKQTIPKTILELGTGSGAISLWLSKQYPQSTIVSTDISQEVLDIAKINMNTYGCTNITFKQADWFDTITGTFDLIVSNPPYLTEAEWQSAAPEVKDFEPMHALISTDAGLKDLHHIVKTSYTFLNTGGLLALETGIEHHKSLQDLAKVVGYTQTESFLDVHKRDRFFFAWK